MYIRKLLPKTESGEIPYEDIPLEDAPIVLGDHVAEVRRNKHGHACVICYGDVYVCGRVCSGTQDLHHNDLIAINNNTGIFVFKDEAERAKRRQTRQIKLQKISEAKREEGDSVATIRREVVKEFNLFITSCENIITLKDFALQFCNYAKTICKFDRTIMYFPKLKPPKKIVFVPLAALAPEKTYKPSRTTLDAMYESGEPVYIITRERKEEELSFSIVQQEIKSVLAFPIFNKSHRVISLFYADASEEEVPRRAFIRISYFCEHLAPYLVTFLTGKVPELKEIKLDEEK